MRRFRAIDATALVAMAVTAGIAACGPSEASEADPEGQADGAAFTKIVNVETRRAVPADFTSFVRITGEVQAYRDVVLSAQESGILRRYFLEKGSAVRRGQPIAAIDDRVLKAQVEEARAVSRLAEERWRRQRKLWEDEHVGSEMAYLQARYDAESAAARLETLEARLSHTVIESPIGGVFDEKYVDAGEMVGPGTRVARVIQTGRLKIEGGVPERFAPRVHPGASARITFDVLPGQAFEGVIGFVGSAVDPASRTFPIEIVMENPGRIVKPSMVANVSVAIERLGGALVVPQEAVLRTETGYQLMVIVRGEGAPVVEGRAVALGPSYENRVVIEDGLEPGDEYVVVGQQLVDPGDHVRILNERDASADGPGGGTDDGR
ncbi:MAG: efflux RND transporter periplasmic adaptor subunit [Gemmatimonadota bacterium]